MIPNWQKPYVTYVGNRLVDRLDRAPKAWMLWSRNAWKLCGNIYAVEPDDPVVYLVPRSCAGVSGPVYRAEDTLDYLASHGKLEEAFAALKTSETVH